MPGSAAIKTNKPKNRDKNQRPGESDSDEEEEEDSFYSPSGQRGNYGNGMSSGGTLNNTRIDRSGLGL